MAGTATVEKALDLLFHLHASGSALGLTEIGRDLGLPKSSCHRLLAALVDREIVERDEGGRYRPGLALLSLGLGAQAREPVVRAARPILESEVLALGETVFVVARRHQQLRVLDRCEGSGFLRVAPEIGDPIPAESTAVGRLYRVFAGEADTAALGPDPFDAFTAEHGYAVNRDAWIEGLSVLAVPIWREDSREGRELIAALALGAASARFAELGEALIAERLLRAAAHVAERLDVVHPSSQPGREARRRRDAPVDPARRAAQTKDSES